MTDEEYMQMAIELAERGRGWSAPNPVVGAVIVKEGRVIGRGYHARCGELHAERNALADCTEDAAGATLYVTLEPCCHYGRTPPCTEAILRAKIKRVVIGAMDPNPLVAGRGAALLRENGVCVESGVLREACEEQNRIFFHYIKTRRPYVTLKYAMTLDGKIATAGGASKWITGEEARMQVQRLRHERRGIMVGAGTVLADDPRLNCRLPDGRNPVRIICDTRLRTPPDAKIVKTAGQQPTIIATACEDAARQEVYRNAGCDVLLLPRQGESIDLRALMEALGAREIDSILLEGGGTLAAAALGAGIVQEIYAYVAPKLFGGAGAKTPVEGVGVSAVEDAYRLSDVRVRQVGTDILITGRLPEREVTCLPESLKKLEEC